MITFEMLCGINSIPQFDIYDVFALNTAESIIKMIDNGDRLHAIDEIGSHIYLFENRLDLIELVGSVIGWDEKSVGLFRNTITLIKYIDPNITSIHD